MASLKGKVIAITGAAGGIGSVTADLLASRGASLSLADMDEKALNETARGIRDKHKINVLTTKVDHFGKLSGGVNLAGTVGKEIGLKAAHEVSDEDFDLVMAINVRGVMACQRAQLQNIEDGGSIVNATSVAGKIGIPNLLAYGASKHAVIVLTRTAAMENGHRRVRVNAVAPGSIDTKMLGKTEEVAALIAFLLSDEAAFITGAVYTIDGGMTP
ncbi:uncharacterized protein Z519_00911 [Cladophialophora bantiana CBS 173.52]|uniref:Uncharacterized protein n=1 Tax=Cladophialophora bantiana (strain ATCC 10958 / CBS 173.52 / CDC B-1940 / NIH 8579) TaxID=1442370 RepID=A0A0D2I0J9_CLAB1|nr:uncharacterized protein Z519_00911 [Cladophialophora bantiana CBS 173.52]KIW99248.1 hypothetical protein Z519_00911 [Cladophialophora bantiana CBS 173.52]